MPTHYNPNDDLDENDDDDDSDDPLPGDVDESNEPAIGADTLPCPNCRREIYEDSDQCPHCGCWVLPLASGARSHHWLWTLAAAAALVGFLFLTMR